MERGTRIVNKLHNNVNADTDVPGVEYGVLGHLEVRVRETGSGARWPKQRGVLAMLIAAAGRAVSVDALPIATHRTTPAQAVRQR